MMMVVVMGAGPDTRGTQAQQSDKFHQLGSSPGLWKNGSVLMVVVDDEKSQCQQA